MGILGDIVDGVGDVVGDVVGGVIDVVDDVFGIDLHKVLGNKWVKRAMMAASIFTGGVAIVNGVMQGFSAASAASTFSAKFVQGAAGFVKGVAAGLANPVDTAKNIGNTIMGGNAQVAADLGRAGQEAALKNTPTDLLVDGADTTQKLSVPGSPVPTPQSTSLTSPNFDASVQPDLASSNMEMPSPSSGPSSASADFLQQNAETLKQAGGAQEPGILSRLAKGAGNFASSPAGMQTIASGMQGYAQARMMEKRDKRAMEQERARRDSFQGFGERAPRAFNIPALTDLRNRTERLYNHSAPAGG